MKAGKKGERQTPPNKGGFDGIDNRETAGIMVVGNFSPRISILCLAVCIRPRTGAERSIREAAKNQGLLCRFNGKLHGPVCRHR